jgi:predicted RNase H-like HicB family nuclease
VTVLFRSVPNWTWRAKGGTREEARSNLTEAIEGFLEAASPSEIQDRLSAERYVESVEVQVA